MSSSISINTSVKATCQACFQNKMTKHASEISGGAPVATLQLETAMENNVLVAGLQTNFLVVLATDQSHKSVCH